MVKSFVIKKKVKLNLKSKHCLFHWVRYENGEMESPKVDRFSLRSYSHSDNSDTIHSYSKTRRVTSTSTTPKLLQLDSFQEQWISLSEQRVHQLYQKYVNVHNTLSTKTKRPPLIKRPPLSPNVNDWTGLFIQRIYWNPSYLSEWLHEQQEQKKQEQCQPSTKDKLELIELFPPLYQQWLQQPQIREQLIKNIKLWISATTIMKWRWSSVHNYRVILQLCYDLNMYNDFEYLWNLIPFDTLSWTEIASLYTIF